MYNPDNSLANSIIDVLEDVAAYSGSQDDFLGYVYMNNIHRNCPVKNLPAKPRVAGTLPIGQQTDELFSRPPLHCTGARLLEHGVGWQL